MSELILIDGLLHPLAREYIFLREPGLPVENILPLPVYHGDNTVWIVFAAEFSRKAAWGITDSYPVLHCVACTEIEIQANVGGAQYLRFLGRNIQHYEFFPHEMIPVGGGSYIGMSYMWESFNGPGQGSSSAYFLTVNYTENVFPVVLYMSPGIEIRSMTGAPVPEWVYERIDFPVPGDESGMYQFIREKATYFPVLPRLYPVVSDYVV